MSALVKLGTLKMARLHKARMEKMAATLHQAVMTAGPTIGFRVIAAEVIALEDEIKRLKATAAARRETKKEVAA